MEPLIRHHTPSTPSLLPSSPRFMSPRTTPRRSSRASRAHTSDLTPNKENLTPVQLASTSAKTLDMVSSIVTSSPAKRKSPFSSASRRIRASNVTNVDQAEILSSSDESDDSAVVFFGQPSSAEKQRRVRYEQKVIEKRLKHKDSLDLTRQRPISFNPDDTMLMEDASAAQYSWSIDGPTPAPAKPAHMIVEPRQRSPLKSTQLASSPLKGSPVNASRHEIVDDTAADAQNDGLASLSTPGLPRSSVQATALHSGANPFLDWSSPRKTSYASPQKFSSPVRSVETLIGATLSQQRAPRSARRSPRLSLRRLQLSSSPSKPADSTVQQHSLIVTPFAKVAAPPPSTGLSGFACLRIASVPAAAHHSATQIPEEQASPSMHAAARGTQAPPEALGMIRETQSSPPAHPVRLVSPSRPGRSLLQAMTPTPQPTTIVSANSPGQDADQDYDDVSIKISHQPPAKASSPVLAGDETKVSPGPIFRQTARRVPIQQHEAEFGVKLSPDKRGSPYKSHGKSSALRSQEPMAWTDRIPARRVQMHATQPATDPIVPSKAIDAILRRPPSVASKVSRTAGPFVNRLGSRGASSTLPPAVLSRAVSAPVSAPAKPPLRTQSVASKPTVIERASSSQASPKRPSSGLPRPALSNGSRLPRPASTQAAPAGARPATRPVPMAIARLAPSAQALAAKSAQSVCAPGTEAPVPAAVHTDSAAPLPKQTVSSPRKVSSEQASAPPPAPAKVASPVRAASARTASPVRRAPVKAVSPARPTPAVVRDPEQQRLRCLAMQERARNRPQRSASANNLSSSSSEADSPLEARSSPIRTMDSPEVGSDPSPEPSSSPVKSDVSAGPVTGPRSLRASRSVRTLTPSAQRVPAARGRALSLNDIIAARKVDVPLTLTDQLRLADTVNKKQNEKILAKYKITKVHHPYERPPSPDQHVHEPEACIIVDDQGNHRKGKGDLSAYSTPPRTRPMSSKSVKWYRPLFVDRGSHYGNKKRATRPALKQVSYNLDKLGNKMATGASPKLTVGQPVIIFRNYFKGESVPDDA